MTTNKLAELCKKIEERCLIDVQCQKDEELVLEWRKAYEDELERSEQRCTPSSD